MRWIGGALMLVVACGADPETAHPPSEVAEPNAEPAPEEGSPESPEPPEPREPEALGAAPNGSEANGPPPTACTTAEECTLLTGTCGLSIEAVHRDDEARVRADLARRARSASCPSPGPLPPSRPLCRDGRCGHAPLDLPELRRPCRSAEQCVVLPRRVSSWDAVAVRHREAAEARFAEEAAAIHEREILPAGRQARPNAACLLGACLVVPQ